MPVTAPTPGQILPDFNSTFVAGDAYGIWIADANSGGTGPFVLRYALDSGRWLAVPVTNSIPFINNRCMASDPVNKRLYVLQYDGSSTTYLTVIDTTASGSQTYGTTAINGIVNTFTITDQLGGSLTSAPVGLVFDSVTGTLWTATRTSENNSDEGFYQIDPNTGTTTFFDVSSYLFSTGFGPYDIFATGGFLYWASNFSEGTVYQFSASSVTPNWSQQIFDGGLNSGQVTSFSVDPTTGNVSVMPTGGDSTLFSTSGGYVTFNSAGLLSATSGYGNRAIAYDDVGYLWQFTWGNPPNSVTNGFTTKNNTPPSNYGQANPYGATWAAHTNGNPNLFMVDDGSASGVAGALYASNDTNTEGFYQLSNTLNAPNIMHVVPSQLVPEFNTLYPANDQQGLWIGSYTLGCTPKIVRYSPAREEDSAFFLVPLPDSAIIPSNGIADDQANQNRFYVLDQANSYIWVIDTTPILDGGGNLNGVNGILGYIDLTSQWAPGSATFAGLAFDSVTTQYLFIGDGSTTVYKINPITSAITVVGEPNGIQSYGLITGSGVGGPSSAQLFWMGPGASDLLDPNTLGFLGPFTWSTAAPYGASNGGDFFYIAGQDGFMYALGGPSGSQEWNLSPSDVSILGNTLAAHPNTSAQGVAAGDAFSGTPTAWFGVPDPQTGFNYIINYSFGVSYVQEIYIKTIPSPFAFSVTVGNYGQGNYGFAWLTAPVAKVFVSDDTNNELWSGDGSNSYMGVETTFPYVAGEDVDVSASVVSDSSVLTDLGVSFAITASLITDSSVEAVLVEYNVFPTATILATSSMLGRLTQMDNPIVTCLADSQVNANVIVRHGAQSGIMTAASVTANLTQFFQRHAVGVTGGNSGASATLRLAGSRTVAFQNGKAPGTFVTPVGTRDAPTPPANTKQPQFRIKKT